ncbi:MAG: hypothetical protein IPP34_08015 [Bacteroidetes bacterium]|nr:hypothetical protein [Bacteroidota bacterium]
MDFREVVLLSALIRLVKTWLSIFTSITMMFGLLITGKQLLPSSKEQSTVDQIADYDYPAAVELIKRVSGKTEFDVVVHCVGSIAMFMALLKGTVTGIRSVVAAQIACDIIPAPQVKWKCGLYLPELFDALGVKSITAYVDEEADWENKLFDKFLKLYAEPLEDIVPVQPVTALLLCLVLCLNMIN